MNEEEVKEIEFRISLEGLILSFFSTPEWLKIIDENPETYAEMADEAIASAMTAKSYEDLPKWMYDTLDKMGALVSEEERAQKSMDDWNPNE
jgi:hypothetical protein